MSRSGLVIYAGCRRLPQSSLALPPFFPSPLYFTVTRNLSKPCPGLLSQAGHAIFVQVSFNSLLCAFLASPNLASSCPSLPWQPEGSLKIHILACHRIASTLALVSQEVQILTFQLLSRVYKEHPSLSGLLFLHPLPLPCPSQASLLKLPGRYSPFITAQVPPPQGKSTLTNVVQLRVGEHLHPQHVASSAAHLKLTQHCKSTVPQLKKQLPLKKKIVASHTQQKHTVSVMHQAMLWETAVNKHTTVVAPRGLTPGPSLHHINYHSAKVLVSSSGHH